MVLVDSVWRQVEALSSWEALQRNLPWSVEAPPPPKLSGPVEVPEVFQPLLMLAELTRSQAQMEDAETVRGRTCQRFSRVEERSLREGAED